MRGRRKLWLAAGVAGLTGVVGLAALGGLAARDDKSGDSERLSDAQASAPKQNVSDAGRADETLARPTTRPSGNPAAEGGNDLVGWRLERRQGPRNTTVG